MHVGRGRSRNREMMARGGAVNRMVVDHRPRALAILGVTQEEKEELMPHFVVRIWQDLSLQYYSTMLLLSNKNCSNKYHFIPSYIF